MVATACLPLLAFGAGAGEAGRSPYAALESLVGEWNTGPEGAPPTFVQRISWGTRRSYLRYSASLARAADAEHLHLEGMIVWNPASRRFDYLFVVEPGSLSLEQGEIRVEADGLVVREVLLARADGSLGRFRQTFRALSDGTFETSLMRQDGETWQPTFPGSERLVMTRRQP